MKELQRAYFSCDLHKRHLHYHDCHQLILIVKGEIRVKVGKTSFCAQGGQLLMFSRYENHSLEILSQDYERYVIHISPSADMLYSVLSNRPEGFSNIIELGVEFNSFKAFFERLCTEFSSDKWLREDMLELLLKELMIMLRRVIPYREINCENALIVSSIQRLFENEYQNRYTLSYLAEKYSVSVSTLSHGFKKITGSSVMDYLFSCRIASAKNMLAKTDLSIGEIVDKCGFSDSSNFSRAFKNQIGMTPHQFRKMYNNRKGL